MVACQWNKSSPIGPAEQEEGGSRSRSLSSYLKLKYELVFYIRIYLYLSTLIWFFFRKVDISN